ncbi:MAG: biotin/lipoyl-binding protein [Methylocella sp.]
MQIDRKTIRRRRNRLLLLIALVLAAGALAYAIDWWLFGRFWVATDNAFVTGNLIPVYADATGIVAEVYYEETEDVKKGDLLVRLDAQRATAALGEAEGELGRAVRAVGALFAARQQACQKILSRAALFDKVRHDIVRYRQALPSG